jgi:hypothetical protein
MISKSASEYLRRKRIVAENRNCRESGRIRYQNMHTIIGKENELPGMEEYITFQPNLKSVYGLNINN